MAAPRRLETNALLARHGQTGWLMVRLQRYAIAGWIAFFVLFALFVLLVFVSTLAPRPVIAVSPGGRVLGRIEYLHAGSRSDAEILAAARHFADDYLSLNSATIFNDYAAALNMMSPALRRATLAALRREAGSRGGDYLARVRAARTRSRLSFDQQPGGTRLLWRHGLQARVQVGGVLHVRDRQGRARTQPFELVLDARIVARTMADTAGIEITGIQDR